MPGALGRGWRMLPRPEGPGFHLTSRKRDFRFGRSSSQRRIEFFRGDQLSEEHAGTNAALKVGSTAPSPNAKETLIKSVGSPSGACMLALVVKRHGAIGTMFRGGRSVARPVSCTRAWALDGPPALFSIRPRRIGGMKPACSSSTGDDPGSGSRNQPSARRTSWTSTR